MNDFQDMIDDSTGGQASREERVKYGGYVFAIRIKEFVMGPSRKANKEAGQTFRDTAESLITLINPDASTDNKESLINSSRRLLDSH